MKRIFLKIKNYFFPVKIQPVVSESIPQVVRKGVIFSQIDIVRDIIYYEFGSCPFTSQDVYLEATEEFNYKLTKKQVYHCINRLRIEGSIQRVRPNAKANTPVYVLN
jgi:hypothetical protein